MFYPVVCEQLFSRKSVSHLWQRRGELDAGQMAIIKSLYDNRRQGSIQGSVRIEYNLSRTVPGKLGYGRLYGTRGSLETLEKEIRGTVCEEFYHDIDMVNAHPVILEQFARRLGTPLKEVEHLIQNRDLYLTQVGGTRDEAKEAIIKILYGGKNEYSFLIAFEKEVSTFARTLSTQDVYADLMKYIRKQDGNVYGTFLSFILQTEERKIMLCMKSSLEKQGWSVDVLSYDGVMIRKDIKMKFTEEVLRQTEKDVAAETGYTISLVDKKFTKFEIAPESLSEEISQKVTTKVYEQRKEEFEKDHFYYAKTNMIADISSKQLCFYTLEHASTLYNTFDFIHSNMIEDRTSFLKLWLKDGTRRTHFEIDMKPSDDVRVYTTPLQMAYKDVECDYDINKPELRYFRDLVKLASSDNLCVEVYILNWFAHILQKPFENPGVAIILTGQMGCGKDTLLEFFGQFVLGKQYFHNYTSTADFWMPYDENRMGKLLIKIEEAQGFLNRQQVGPLKARITSDELTINPKGQKPISAKNYNRLCMTTNEGSSVKLETGDRRFLLANYSPYRVGDSEYWTKLRACLFTKEAGAIVAKYLLDLPLENFDVRKIPMTEYKKAAMLADKSPEEKFIEQWDGKEVLAKDLFCLYTSYCHDNMLPCCFNLQSFGHKLLPFTRDSKIDKKRCENGFVYFKVF